jgi:mannose-6-phosphate isomerase-like protein (cupin superfamily)
MAANLMKLLTEGKNYLWALRHAQMTRPTLDQISAARDALAAAGIDLATLAALRELAFPLARFPYPALQRADHTQYYFFPIPAFDIEIFFTVLLTEWGLELGMELFPGKVDWQFGHREVQYCIGGDTEVEMILPSNEAVTRRVRVGDVVAVPSGANFVTHSAEEGGKYGHAHIFLVNEGEQLGQIYYDVGGMLRLQTLGLVELPPGGAALPFADITERIEVKRWSELLHVDKTRTRDLPSWLRHGWQRREEARALDYAEGTKTVVISSPDRDPADFIEWGSGPRRCHVNPLIAEHTAAVTDCHFPSGYRRLHVHKEIWCVLQGQAKIKQSIPPLHAAWVDLELRPEDVMAAAGGAHFHVLEASSDFVVRRMAESCAHNAHCAMMERKLELDGVSAAL